MDDESDAKPAGKVRLMTLDDIDRRTAAASKALALRDSLLSDLGGAEVVSTAKQQLVQHSAVLGAMAEDFATRYLRGEPIVHADYLATINAQRRSLQTAGLERHAKDITGTLRDRLMAGQREAAE